jgi:hypothetical protein
MATTNIFYSDSERKDGDICELESEHLPEISPHIFTTPNRIAVNEKRGPRSPSMKAFEDPHLARIVDDGKVNSENHDSRESNRVKLKIGLATVIKDVQKDQSDIDKPTRTISGNNVESQGDKSGFLNLKKVVDAVVVSHKVSDIASSLVSSKSSVKELELSKAFYQKKFQLWIPMKHSFHDDDDHDEETVQVLPIDELLDRVMLRRIRLEAVGHTIYFLIFLVLFAFVLVLQRPQPDILELETAIKVQIFSFIYILLLLLLSLYPKLNSGFLTCQLLKGSYS